MHRVGRYLFKRAETADEFEQRRREMDRVVRRLHGDRTEAVVVPVTR